MAFQLNANKGTHSQPMAEINTTPLVDVMLVLLVIFIVTAPLFHQAVSIDLPKVDSAKLENKQRTVQVVIDGAGGIFIDGAIVQQTDLVAVFGQHVQTGQDVPEMQLRADRGIRYEKVTEVMGAAQAVGITKIAFVTERPMAQTTK